MQLAEDIVRHVDDAGMRRTLAALQPHAILDIFANHAAVLPPATTLTARPSRALINAVDDGALRVFALSCDPPRYLERDRIVHISADKMRTFTWQPPPRPAALPPTGGAAGGDTPHILPALGELPAQLAEAPAPHHYDTVKELVDALLEPDDELRDKINDGEAWDLPCLPTDGQPDPGTPWLPEDDGGIINALGFGAPEHDEPDDAGRSPRAEAAAAAAPAAAPRAPPDQGTHDAPLGAGGTPVMPPGPSGAGPAAAGGAPAAAAAVTGDLTFLNTLFAGEND
jgi:hypothetical protein